MPQVAPFVAGLFSLTAPALGTAAFGAYVAGAGLASFLTTTALGEFILIAGASELVKALSPKQTTPAAVGINGSSSVGEKQPEEFILGRFSTAGWAVVADATHSDGSTPNAYLTQVRELSGVPIAGLNRVAFNGEWVTLGPDDGSGYGQPVQGKYAGYAWIKFYDGSQTVADPMLLAKYPAPLVRPWGSDMIGTGIAYAIATFKYNRNLFPSAPQVTYEVDGAKLYDPRKDSTVGGSGSHRWGVVSTYEGTDNPIVMSYNIGRGITVGADVWGGEYAAADVPLSEWFAAMNACDASVSLSGGGTEPAWRAGYKITTDMHPADVMDTLKATASAEFAEVGGTLKVRVGAPGLPVYTMTDEDVIVSSPDQLLPFPGLDKTYNAINANFPDPDSFYQSKAAPIRTDTAYQTADGNRFLPAALNLPACPYPNQVQRLQLALLQDDRRFLRHQIVLPPDAVALEPGDAISWTSAVNGYTAKIFEVTQIEDDQVTALQTVWLRERDSSDYNWTSGDELAATAPAVTTQDAPGAQNLAGFAVAQAAVVDTASTARMSAVMASWTALASTADIQMIRVQVRRQSDGALVQDVAVTPDQSQIICSQGIVEGITYEMRGLIVPYSARETTWTGWTAVIAPDVTVTPSAGEVTTVTIADAAIANRVSATVSFTDYAGSYGYYHSMQSLSLATEGSLDTLVVVSGVLKFTTTSPSSPTGSVVVIRAVDQDTAPNGLGGYGVALYDDYNNNNHATFNLPESNSEQTIPFNFSFLVQSDAGTTTISVQANLFASDYTTTPFTWEGTISISELKR